MGSLGAATSPSVSTDISILNNVSGIAEAPTVVRVSSGVPENRSEVEVAAVTTRSRLRRRRKERRGRRWLRGKMSINFGFLGSARRETVRRGEIRLNANGHIGGNLGDTSRKKFRNQETQKEDATIEGIPFNYHYLLNRTYNRLGSTKERPFDDLKVRALAVQDNGNTLPLCVTGISTALIDMGYVQKDFLVAATALVDSGEIFCEPTKIQEKRIRLTKLQAGQGLLMVQYYAHTNRIAHVFAKGNIDLDIYKKALAECVAVCQNAAAAVMAVLYKKYDKSMEISNRTEKLTSRNATAPARPGGAGQDVALKASFGQMLSEISTSALQSARKTVDVNSDSTEVGKSVPLPAVPIQPLSSKTPSTAAKKPTLADLAKRKKN